MYPLALHTSCSWSSLRHTGRDLVRVVRTGCPRPGCLRQGCLRPGYYLGSLSLTTPGFVASENRLEFLDFEFQKPDCRTSRIKNNH